MEGVSALLLLPGLGLHYGEDHVQRRELAVHEVEAPDEGGAELVGDVVGVDADREAPEDVEESSR